MSDTRLIRYGIHWIKQTEIFDKKILIFLIICPDTDLDPDLHPRWPKKLNPDLNPHWPKILDPDPH
jgi:hypothetical protein